MIVPEMLGGGERDCKLLLLAAAVLVGIISSLQVAVRAEVYNVGDGGGWTTDTNYTQWAAQYTFREGDTIGAVSSQRSSSCTFQNTQRSSVVQVSC